MKKSWISILLLALAWLALWSCSPNQQDTSEPAQPQPANTWTHMADFPGQPVMKPAGFVLNNRAYLGTGLVDWRTVNGAPELDLVDEFWEYQADGNSWKRKADYPGGPMANAVGFSIDSAGFIGLGTDSSNQANRELWSYDVNTDKWTRRADFPGLKRFKPVGEAVGGQGYVIGGMDISNGVYTHLRDVWAYNAQNDTWTRKADLPGENRWNSVVFVIGSRIYVGLGESDRQPARSFWAYETSSDSWTAIADFPGRLRIGANATAVGGKGYLGLGCAFDNDEDLKDLWQYDPQTDSWKQIESLPAQGEGRVDPACFALGNDLYIGLGKKRISDHSVRPFADFWKSTFTAN